VRRGLDGELDYARIKYGAAYGAVSGSLSVIIDRRGP